MSVGAPVADRPAAAARPPAVRAAGLRAAPALLVALLTWVLYLPTAARVVQLSPDMVEFVDIARRLLASEGYLLGIKAYHIGGSAVVHDGLVHRPPLFTFLTAGLLGIGLGVPSVQVVNAGFGAISALLVYSLGARLFGVRVGLAAGVLAAFSPIALEQQVQALSDPLATMLTLLAVRLTLAAAERGQLRLALAAGLLFGLGYLTRPPVVAVWLAVLALLAIWWRRRPEVRPAVLGLVLGVALIAGPVSLWSLAERGRLSYSGKGYLYGVVSDADVMEHGYVSAPLSPPEFVTSRPAFVLGAIWDVTTLYARLLVVEREGLGPLALAWPAVLVVLVRRMYPWTAGIVLAAAGSNFVVYALTWSAWQDRYILTTLLLLLPFAVDGLSRTIRAVLRWLGRVTRRAPGETVASALLGVAVLGVAAVWAPRFLDQYGGQFRYGERPAGTRVDYGIRWSGPPRWVNDGSLEEALEWILEHTDRHDVLAHGQPWPYSFFTGRPSVLLPYRLDDEQLRRFLVEYRVAYVLYDPRDPQRRDYREQLQDLSGSGVRSTRVESMIVFDTRPLWQ